MAASSLQLKQLSKCHIEDVLDKVCKKVSDSLEGAVCRPRCLKAPGESDFRLGFDVVPSSGNEHKRQEIMTCSLYIAYSTWDGRFLFLDELDMEQEHISKEEWWTSVAVHVSARIAVALGCSRLTWRRYDALKLNIEKPPDFLKGWLTVYWEVEAMESFLGIKPGNGVPENTGDLLSQLSNEDFQLRLATKSDIPDLMALVQGLADFEKEPDAVNTTEDVFDTDGFGNHPLFHCILLEHRSNRGDPPNACGMAFHYTGCCESSSGPEPFLYLEDLFVQQDHRQKGAGTLLMKALATLALRQGRKRMVWQVLDWNTPARDFYESLGAKIQTGLDTFRYTGLNLQEVSCRKLLP